MDVMKQNSGVMSTGASTEWFPIVYILLANILRGDYSIEKFGTSERLVVLYNLTTASSGGNPDDFDSVVPEQVNLPPRRRLPLRLGASFPVMLSGLLSIVAVGCSSSSDCSRLVCWLSECHVCAYRNKNTVSIYCIGDNDTLYILLES